MSEDLSKLLSGMLSNPDALKNMLGSLSASPNPTSQAEAPLPAEKDIGIQDMLSKVNRSDDRRITLLTALKPYLSTSRATNIDKAIQLIRLTKMTEVLRNERE